MCECAEKYCNVGVCNILALLIIVVGVIVAIYLITECINKSKRSSVEKVEIDKRKKSAKEYEEICSLMDKQFVVYKISEGKEEKAYVIKLKPKEEKKN